MRTVRMAVGDGVSPTGGVLLGACLLLAAARRSGDCSNRG